MFLYLLNIFCLFILFRLLCLGWPFVGWKSVVLPYCGACSLWVGLCSILCNSMNCSTPGKHSLSFTISLSLLKLMSIESGMPSNHPIFCCPLLLSSVFPSIRVFSNKSTFHIRWPKYWSFSFRTSPSNEYSGLISFKSDWFDLLAVQRTLKSLFYTTIRKHQFLVLSLLYGSALTYIHDYWKNHNFDYMDLRQQSDLSAF